MGNITFANGKKNPNLRQWWEPSSESYYILNWTKKVVSLATGKNLEIHA